MALRAVPNHPKFAALKARLKQPKGMVLGWLEAVWHFAGQFTPQGDIGKYSDTAIESWVEWNGEPGALIAALVEEKWIDVDPAYRLLVHDWPQHADKATKAALGRAKLPFCVPTVDTPGTHVAQVVPAVLPVSVPPVPVPVPVPEPGPVPEPPQAAKTVKPPKKPSPTHNVPDSVDNRILCERVGIFDIRQQADMHKLYEVHGRSAKLDAEAAMEHMVSRWVEYREIAPSLEWQYGSAYKFFMSGKWDDPRSWPRGKAQMDVYEKYLAEGEHERQ